MIAAAARLRLLPLSVVAWPAITSPERLDIARLHQEGRPPDGQPARVRFYQPAGAELQKEKPKH